MAEKKIPKVTHCAPAWTFGPRPLHPKFGGGKMVGGIARVEQRLKTIKQHFPDDLSSGHVFHEVRADGPYERFNSPDAISFKYLCAGIAEGRFPDWSVITSPAFGTGILSGMILNPHPEIVEISKWGHRHAILWSRVLAKKGLGAGLNVWWPGFDSRAAFGPLAQLSYYEARERLVNYWVGLLREYDFNPVMHFEYKPSVPGKLDFFPTMQAAIDFCLEVNQQLGRKGMMINLEWAHALIGGQTVAEATKMQIEAGLFSGLVHVNSAELAVIEWDKAGVNIIKGTPGDDADWPVGHGGELRWEDQEEAVALMLESGVERIIAEHDIDPSGLDPVWFYGESRKNLELMIASAQKKLAAVT